jgi:hypothetical protein
MKNIFIIVISFFIISCEKKEKTYEELETEAFSDILPEVIKYELKESFLRAKRLPLIPPPDLDSIKYSKNQLDSIVKNFDDLNKKYVKNFEKKIDSSINVIEQFKKYEILIIDTLRYVEKLKIDKNVYLFDSLQPRKTAQIDFSKCKLKIKLISIGNTFEGYQRNSQKPVLFPTRILFDENKENGFFTILRLYGSYHVFIKFSDELNKWEIDKILEDSEISSE